MFPYHWQYMSVHPSMCWILPEDFYWYWYPSKLYLKICGGLFTTKNKKPTSSYIIYVNLTRDNKDKKWKHQRMLSAKLCLGCIFIIHWSAATPAALYIDTVTSNILFNIWSLKYTDSLIEFTFADSWVRHLHGTMNNGTSHGWFEPYYQVIS